MDINQPKQDDDDLKPDLAPQNPPPSTPPAPSPPQTPPSPTPPSPPQTPPPTPPPAPTPPSLPPNRIPLQQPPEQNVGVGTPNIGVEEKQVPRSNETPPTKSESPASAAQIEVADYQTPPPPPPSAKPAPSPVQVKNYQSPTPPNRPQPPVKAPGSNASLVLFIILALILGSAGGFFGFKYYDKLKSSASVQTSPSVSPSPNLDVNTWQTYTSDLYQFSLKYPTTWAASTTSDQAETIVFASNEESLLETLTGFKIEINFQNANDQTLKKWVETNTAATGEKKAAKEITVSGETAYQQELAKTGPKVATYIERPEKIMIVTYSAPEDIFGQGGDWYNNLINSIELTP